MLPPLQLQVLPDDLLREILLRLPPQQPSSLLRASLVCKHWRSLVTDPRFIQRLRASVLGVFFNNPPVLFPEFIPAGDPPDRIPDSRFHPPGPRWLIRDCRRGRALLHNGKDLLVWDPLSSSSPEKRKHLVPEPPTASVCGGRSFHGFGAVLLVGEHDFRFRVAIALVNEGVALASVYSSDTGAWACPVTAAAPTSSSCVPWKEKPGAVVGDTVYWLLDDDRVLSLELHTAAGAGLQVVRVLEPRNVPAVDAQNVQLMTTPDCKLGLASLAASAAMSLWTLEIDGCSTASWTLRRTVRLDALLPRPVRRLHPDHHHHIGAVQSLTLALVLHQHDDNSDSNKPCTARIVGVHEDGSMVFLKTNGHVLFMLQLEPTLHIKKMGKMFLMNYGFDTVYSYASIFL